MNFRLVLVTLIWNHFSLRVMRIHNCLRVHQLRKFRLAHPEGCRRGLTFRRNPSARGQPQRSGWTETQVQHVHEYSDALFGRVRMSVPPPQKNPQIPPKNIEQIHTESPSCSLKVLKVEKQMPLLLQTHESFYFLLAAW